MADFAAGLAAVVDGMRADRGGPQMGDQQHYEQGGTWHGRLRVGDRERTTSGCSCGTTRGASATSTATSRPSGRPRASTSGRLFCNAIGIPRGDRVIGIGMVVDESGVRSTTQVAAAFDPAPGSAPTTAPTVRYGDPLGAHPLRRDAVPRPHPPSPLRARTATTTTPSPGSAWGTSRASASWSGPPSSPTGEARLLESGGRS